MKFVEEFTEVFIERLIMLNNIWFTDVCLFWMNGYVNKQSMHLQWDKNPYEIEEARFHPEKLTVRAAFSSHGIIGPVFFFEMVLLEFCHKLLSENVLPELKNWEHLKKPFFCTMVQSRIWLTLFSYYCKKLSKNMTCDFKPLPPHLFYCSWLWTL